MCRILLHLTYSLLLAHNKEQHVLCLNNGRTQCRTCIPVTPLETRHWSHNEDGARFGAEPKPIQREFSCLVRRPAYSSEETVFLCLLSMMRLIKAQIIILQKGRAWGLDGCSSRLEEQLQSEDGHVLSAMNSSVLNIESL